MIKKLVNSSANFFDRLMRQYTPDPFILALILSAIVLVASVLCTPTTPKEIVLHWGDGFWKLIPFTMQMVMIFLGGYVFASTPFVKRFLDKLSKCIKTPGKAVLVVSIVSCVGCWMNWGFGLVVSGLLCRELARTVPKANFRLMVASAYSGFLVWHGGLSGSIPLTIATPGNFTEAAIGGLIPVSQTIFAPFNIVAVISLCILLPLVNWLMGSNEPKSYGKFVAEVDEHVVEKPQLMVPAERLEQSKLISLLAGGVGLLYVLFRILDGTFSLGLDLINFLFLFLALFLHKNPKEFIKAVEGAASRVGPILLQFPFYAGIMGMLQGSGLDKVIAGAYVQIATVETFNLLTFYTAGFLNLFIPSGGGQWAVQAPVVIHAAKELGANLPMAAMAVAWGDAWTNMIQPFWALPLLAIAGLKLRDIMGYCVMALFVSGIVLTVVFLVF